MKGEFSFAIKDCFKLDEFVQADANRIRFCAVKLNSLGFHSNAIVTSSRLSHFNVIYLLIEGY